MKASVKRIIWALGWGFFLTLDQHLYWIRNGEGWNEYTVWFSLLIWVLPLLLFTNDEVGKQ